MRVTIGDVTDHGVWRVDIETGNVRCRIEQCNGADHLNLFEHDQLVWSSKNPQIASGAYAQALFDAREAHTRLQAKHDKLLQLVDANLEQLQKKYDELLAGYNQLLASCQSNELDLVMEQRDNAIKAKNDAYAERNQVVALLAAMAHAEGLKVGLAEHIDKPGEEPWDPKWRNVVLLDLADGQVSWHIQLDEVEKMFRWLPKYDSAWDGHDTKEKYTRVAAACARYRDRAVTKSSICEDLSRAKNKLAEEIAYYELFSDAWRIEAERDGRPWVLVKGNLRILSSATFEEAYAYGLKHLGNVPMLIRDVRVPVELFQSPKWQFSDGNVSWHAFSTKETEERKRLIETLHNELRRVGWCGAKEFDPESLLYFLRAAVEELLLLRSKQSESVPQGTPRDLTLRELQTQLPWTIYYHHDFRATPMAHKDFGHALIHVMKATGKLAHVVNDAEHKGSNFTSADVDPYIADLVVCALRLANTIPGRTLDLQTAVEKRIEMKNGVTLSRK